VKREALENADERWLRDGGERGLREKPGIVSEVLSYRTVQASTRIGLVPKLMGTMISPPSSLRN
jgi:hypothetical protein